MRCAKWKVNLERTCDEIKLTGRKSAGDMELFVWGVDDEHRKFPDIKRLCRRWRRRRSQPGREFEILRQEDGGVGAMREDTTTGLLIKDYFNYPIALSQRLFYCQLSLCLCIDNPIDNSNIMNYLYIKDSVYWLFHINTIAI